MQRDAPDGGRVGKIAVQTAALKKKTGIFRAFTNTPTKDDAWNSSECCNRGGAAAGYVHCDTAPFIELPQK